MAGPVPEDCGNALELELRLRVDESQSPAVGDLHGELEVHSPGRLG